MPQAEPRFSQDQYDMLLRCSEKRDMSEWNQRRVDKLDEEILLANADLCGLWLQGANLAESHLEQAELEEADLRGASFLLACLHSANLIECHLEIADLNGADLTGARLAGAHLARADLGEANLSGAYLPRADLRGASLTQADLRGTDLRAAKLQGATCKWALLDGSTLLEDCAADRHTDFRGVGLASARIEPSLKQVLQYNARRLNWEHWYEQHRSLTWLVRPFWWMSDYGRSTGRIIAVFFGLALFFAAMYWIWGLASPPGVVRDLFSGRGVPVPTWLVPIRALYFSVVTMTTLGFGDMHAYPASLWGHLLLMLQVLLGYALLGALVTRFAILFTAGGPAGKFASKDERRTDADERGA